MQCAQNRDHAGSLTISNECRQYYQNECRQCYQNECRQRFHFELSFLVVLNCILFPLCNTFLACLLSTLLLAHAKVTFAPASDTRRQGTCTRTRAHTHTYAHTYTHAHTHTCTHSPSSIPNITSRLRARGVSHVWG